MSNNYTTIIRENLSAIYKKGPSDLTERLPARKEGENYVFKAFGQECTLTQEKILLSGRVENGPVGVLITLYALNVGPDPLKLEPFRAFKDLPNSMPYQAAFAATALAKQRDLIIRHFDGHDASPDLRGDISFVIYPLPKIALAYICYLPDEEFPASATCLFSSNALSFMPLDGLADVAEYTSKAIIEFLGTAP
ncbi:MAG: DUF3786 domain-containing protein [Deltaproteobacteria bacterium]|nr:DUF3786 domain-containing protein [Deltaproteobacteria bacterium]